MWLYARTIGEYRREANNLTPLCPHSRMAFSSPLPEAQYNFYKLRTRESRPALAPGGFKASEAVPGGGDGGD